MAGLSPITRQQLFAIALLRWRLLVNSLRTVRGRLTMVARVIAGLLVVGAGAGGGTALGFTTWGLTKEGKLEWLTLPLWGILLFWQLFPLMATAFNQNSDASSLVRFPLSYPTYFFVRVVFSAMDIATGLGLCWCLGIFAGILGAAPSLAPVAIFALALFATFNIFLGRVIFFSIEQWLSRRRSREILGLFFFLTVIGFQVAGPLLGRYGDRLAPVAKHIPIKLVVLLIDVQRVSPPGLVALGMGQANRHQPAAAFCFVLMTIYCALTLWLLHVRLQKQFRGEQPSEGEKRRERQAAGALQRGWNLPGIHGALAAVYEKEIRYFSRSGPLLFTLIMPLVVILVVWGGRRGFLTQQAAYALPIGAAYCLLLLTNIVYNSFGADGGGIQFFLNSPVSFRVIAAGKNLAQLSVLALDAFILWLGVRVVYQPPEARVIALTLAWYMFAIPVNLTAGNLLSLYSPKRIDYGTFGRQRASESTILISMLVQLGAAGTGAVSIFIGHWYSNLWISTFILLALALPALATYFFVLARLDRIVATRREVLATELCRA